MPHEKETKEASKGAKNVTFKEPVAKQIKPEALQGLSTAVCKTGEGQAPNYSEANSTLA